MNWKDTILIVCFDLEISICRSISILDVTMLTRLEPISITVLQKKETNLKSYSTGEETKRF